jgi:hypothetical protein
MDSVACAVPTSGNASMLMVGTAHEGSAIYCDPVPCAFAHPTAQRSFLRPHFSRSISAMAAAGARTLAPEIM